MQLHEIIIKAYELLDAADISFELSSEQVCLDELVELREFLDSVPMLEAGGALDSAEPSSIPKENSERPNYGHRF